MSIYASDDPLNRILGYDVLSAFGEDILDLPPRIQIVRGRLYEDPHGVERWRCLTCLQSSVGDEATLALTAEVHRVECVPDAALSGARSDLLESVSNASQALFAAGWMGGIEKILLTSGGMWAHLADQFGWPYEYRGLGGWDSDLDSALARYGLTRGSLNVPPRLPRRFDRQ